MAAAKRKPAPSAPRLTTVRPCVSYDCASIGELVRAIGDEFRDRWGLTDDQEWVYRNAIPPGWHLRLFALASARGLSVAPQVWGFESNDEEAQALAWLMHQANAQPGLPSGSPLPCTSRKTKKPGRCS